MPAGSELFIDYGKLSWKLVFTYILLLRTSSCDHKELQMRLGKQKTVNLWDSGTNCIKQKKWGREKILYATNTAFHTP